MKSDLDNLEDQMLIIAKLGQLQKQNLKELKSKFENLKRVKTYFIFFVVFFFRKMLAISFQAYKDRNSKSSSLYIK